MELKGLMLWKNDFKHERDWLALCKSLDLPMDTMEIELKCVVCVAKKYYTREHYEENNNTMVVKTEGEECIDKQEQ